MWTQKRFHLVSLGCSKNRVDSEIMYGLAQDEGWSSTQDPSQAELIVINTCGFIGNAKTESIDTIFDLAQYKQPSTGVCKKLVVTGCLSQRYPDEMSREMPEVDHFLGSSDVMRLKDVLRDGLSLDRMLVGNPAQWVMRASDPRQVSTGSASAYVKIAEGCNRSCSFCVIPQLRGKQRSRSADDILQDVRPLPKYHQHFESAAFL